ncbi:MAG: sulfite exporter TauE/SafE family protein [Burkholderiales bacterium]|nr:sulfite exporter TauE/SafE family protein [Burkholderiales bacterium]
MDPLLIAALLALGAAIGFAAGLLGIGGGMLTVPFMTLLFTLQKLPPEHIVHMAIATSLATIMFTSVSSVRAHHQRGAVLWPVAARLAPGILVGSLVGARLAGALPSKWLALFFAVFVGFSATQMLLDRKPKPTRQLPGTAGMFGAGGAIGMVSAIVGAGGGFVSVPFMLWCNVRIHNAVATSAALGFPIAAAGTVGYVISGWQLTGTTPGAVGYVHVPALVILAAASVLTAPLGARVAHSLDTARLKRVFAMLLYLLAAYMLLRAARG